MGMDKCEVSANVLARSLLAPLASGRLGGYILAPARLARPLRRRGLGALLVASARRASRLPLTRRSRRQCCLGEVREPLLRLRQADDVLPQHAAEEVLERARPVSADCAVDPLPLVVVRHPLALGEAVEAHLEALGGVHRLGRTGVADQPPVLLVVYPQPRAAHAPRGHAV
eukprot:CAMPEP_0196670254 /NCGR_PEP_ID=MMETSP1090-20130531/1118_1 /TAXON_ID=37098 /ORGANISM="Isochrysis sp, Strain CCMP1244" /LENGTH=170 /DNA_ID=CAMNT_0042007841 /DNA_START=153 /DNA_END=665 /DNA_ORIENTATION=+